MPAEAIMLTGEQIGGLVRHALTTLGGVLVAKGVIDETTLVGLAGAAATIFGAAWSYYVKRKENKNEAA